MVEFCAFALGLPYLRAAEAPAIFNLLDYSILQFVTMLLKQVPEGELVVPGSPRLERLIGACKVWLSIL